MSESPKPISLVVPPKPDLRSETWSRDHLRELSKPTRVGEADRLSRDDLAYVKDARILIRRRLSGGISSWLPWIAFVLVVVLVWWASWAEIEEVTRGIGKVIPSKSIQLIQSLEGGILQEIDVEEGQVVEKGQKVLQISDAIFASTYKENMVKRQVLQARLFRLEAEAAGFEELKFPAEVGEGMAELELNLFTKRRRDYLATKEALEARLKLARQEEELLLDGIKSRAVSPVELIRVQKEVTQVEGELRTLTTTLQREAMEKHHEDKAQLDSLEQALIRDKDRLDRTVIRSPVRGTVNKIHINTVGRVIGSGVDIMEIVPMDDTLLIEANVRPADIAFVHPGQHAKVKFTAYDFSIYGGLEGTLEHIGTNTVTNQDNESFYPIKVRTTQHSLGKDRNGKELEIMPGMVAEVDILTGKKTVLTYLLKPLNRARMRALRER
jgi:adhesin transport system membrane fusion protein